MPNHLTIINVS